MHDLSDFISTHGLIDVPLAGGNFTWSNNREIASMSRIDRFFYTADWEDCFSNLCQKRLVRMCSNRFPIMLRPFRFENMYLKAEDFVERGRLLWDSYQFYSSSSYILANKLNALKVDLKKWNEEEFGNVTLKKNQLLQEINEFDSTEENRPLSAEEKVKKELVKADLEKILLWKK
jgi:hypothetical protein